MNNVEIAFKNHDWSLQGYATRPVLDKLIKENPDISKALWEQYCPWSDSNGGYIKWKIGIGE